MCVDTSLEARGQTSAKALDRDDSAGGGVVASEWLPKGCVVTQVQELGCRPQVPATTSAVQ